MIDIPPPVVVSEVSSAPESITARQLIEDHIKVIKIHITDVEDNKKVLEAGIELANTRLRLLNLILKYEQDRLMEAPHD